LTKDIKRQAYYEKPSERRRRAMRKMVKRAEQTGTVRMPSSNRAGNRER
ncbi:MAG: 30S ribosomal protein S21, partial [Phycisphaeraceae bacterium]|nr:30S ribosomal protein S21 [Phycisphaeraceae bacterium]